MKKLVIIISIMVIPLVAGCALFRPDVDDPELVSAYEAAEEAVADAEYHGAADYAAEKFERAKNKLTDVRDDHMDAPSMQLVKRYREVQILAADAAIDALLYQLEDTEDRLAELEERISTKEDEVAELESERETITADLEQKSEDKARVEREKEELERRVDELVNEKESLRAEKNELEQRLDDQQRLVDRLEESVADIEERASDLQDRLSEKTARLEELEAENKRIVDELEEKVEEVEIREEEHGVVVNVGEKILFEIGDSRLLEEGKQTLATIAEILNDYPDREIHVGGHTCDLPIKEAYPSNWELSAHRALNVLKYLAYAQDVERDRIAAVAYGQFRPLVPNDSDENRQLNRRVEITLLPPELPAETKELD